MCVRRTIIMAKKKEERQKPQKYPISNEFGLYRLCKIPFNEKIFENANYIITPTKKNTDKGIAFATEIGEALNFRKISLLTPKEHDEMIAFLSQLTHCIAVALMTCKDSEDLVNYTGDSFRDLTRIANINENMWTELFLMNKNALLKEMDSFINCMSKLRDFINNEDEEKIKNMMRLSTERRKFFNK